METDKTISDSEKLDLLVEHVTQLSATLHEVVTTLKVYEPLLAKYQRAANAGSMLKARKVFREGE
jgi:hypothetical protein